MAAPRPTAPLITDDGELASIVERVRREPRYALDTEFHRERTYYPRVALVQLAWSDGIALVDPLAVDTRLLAPLLESDALAVLHAADQDLEVLDVACGAIPTRLFDTQLAAGFLGQSFPSLGSLLERELGVKAAKADRLTDWLRRPLTDAQLVYAAADVDNLLALHDTLVAQLEARGRLQWALDECEKSRARPRGNRDPDEAWRRIKEARSLRGSARSVARAVAAWREQRAATLDVPVRFVLPDIAVVGISQRPPNSVAELRATRGLDGKQVRDEVADQLLAVIADAKTLAPPKGEEGRNNELDKELRPAVGLVSAWVSQLGRDLQIDTALLATRSDLEALLRGDPDARLNEGWRAEMAGEPIRRLVSGDAALAFDGHGGLVLEARSHTSIVPGAPSAGEGGDAEDGDQE